MNVDADAASPAGELRSWLARPATEVAPDLLGAVIRHADADGAVAIRLTEVEAYLGADDPGSHAYRGRTKRNAVMFGPAGHLYVYFTYGMHFCVNVVCGEPETATAVLLRAGEVIEGVPLAQKRRPAARVARDLGRGPARLTSALGLGRAHDGVDLVLGDGTTLTVPAEKGTRSGLVQTGPRVGVSGAGGDGERYPWRYWLADEPTVSAYRAHTPRRR